MKQSTKRIGLIILIVVLTIIECLLCLGIALDGKYQVEFSEDLAAIEVCGYQLNYLPWGEDGKTPCFDICPCCGVEFGNEDYTEESLKEYRAKWISEGAHWFDPKLQPQNWSLQEQISNICPHSEDSCIEK